MCLKFAQRIQFGPLSVAPENTRARWKYPTTLINITLAPSLRAKVMFIADTGSICFTDYSRVNTGRQWKMLVKMR